MAKGMILAAGQGTRVRPLTKDLPKPMVPILGKPVMEYLIEHLARHGIKEIMVNVAYYHQRIEEYFGDGSRWGVEIGYSYEGVKEHGDILPRPMGSAGGMRKIQDFSGFFDETTLVLCGDALIDLDITAALEEHKAKGALASVVAMDVPRDEVSSYGIVVSEADGRIQSFQEKPHPRDAKSTLASTGIYIFEPEVLNLVPSGNFLKGRRVLHHGVGNTGQALDEGRNAHAGVHQGAPTRHLHAMFDAHGGNFGNAVALRIAPGGFQVEHDIAGQHGGRWGV